MGPELMQQFRAQAERFGTRFITDDATRIELSDGGIHRVWVGDDEHLAKTVDPGDGRRAEAARHPRRARARRSRRLHLRRLRRRLLQGRGRGRDRRRRLGDGGLDLHLQVRLRADDRPPPRRVPRLEDHAGARRGGRQHQLSRRRTCPRSSSPATTASSRRCASATPRPASVEEIEVGGAFVAIGHTPRSELVRDQVDTDEQGYVLTQRRLDPHQPGRRVRGRRPRRPHLPPGGHRRRHRLHGRARRRVVPARHAALAGGALVRQGRGGPEGPTGAGSGPRRALSRRSPQRPERFTVLRGAQRDPGPAGVVGVVRLPQQVVGIGGGDQAVAAGLAAR